MDIEVIKTARIVLTEIADTGRQFEWLDDIKLTGNEVAAIDEVISFLEEMEEAERLIGDTWNERWEEQG